MGNQLIICNTHCARRMATAYFGYGLSIYIDKCDSLFGAGSNIFHRMLLPNLARVILKVARWSLVPGTLPLFVLIHMLLRRIGRESFVRSFV
ncbi:hypothetical protein V1521DRAFT_429340 [Lipomyces starkeyi]